MSVESKRLHWRDNSESGFSDDPILTITAEGIHDVYRLADHLERGQVEFAAMGRKIKRGLRSKVGEPGWRWLQDYMHGSGGYGEASSQGEGQE